MAPSASESEGEIIESDFDKATTAQPHLSRTSINRKLRDALSPSPEPDSPSPSVNSRDPSRSPYRASRSPRGEKRRWDSHDAHSSDARHMDSRRFKERHRDRQQYPAEDVSGRLSHSFSHSRNFSQRYDDRERPDRRRHNKRPRTRSRSPDGREEAPTNRDRSRHGHSRLENSQPSNRSRKLESGRARNQGDALENLDLGNPNKKISTDKKTDQLDDTTADPDNENTAQKPSESEALSIEERRKRREAIKAKYRAQPNPLLAQALQSDTTPTLTPSGTEAKSPASDSAASPRPESPGTPQVESSRESPPSVTVSDDADLARDVTVDNNTSTNNGVAEEPSAADYDPSMDMQEDRIRQEPSSRFDPLAAAAKNQAGIRDGMADVPIPSIEHEPVSDEQDKVKQNTSVKDDMFASDKEDDDDDMFAPIPASKSKDLQDQSDGTVLAAKAKQLDKSLLDNWDDPDGYYRIILGELLDGRYHVQANLGRGMFSSVVRATDTKTDQLVAIKIIRNNESMLKAGTKEMEILQKLADADPEDKKHVIRLVRSFTHKDHLCMVFENLSINLREVLKKFGRDVGINLKAVRSYAQQMFLGLSLLRKCNILHADLKPDNMLVNESRNMLKVCDLGSAGDASESDITPYLVSRFYRAPEIILGIPYDFAIDMWSVGCTLFELYTGKILFTGRTNNQMLRSIMECRGKFSLKMLKRAEFGAVHFDDQNLNFRSVERDKTTGRDMTRLINFVKPTRDLKTRLMAATGAGNKAGSNVLPDSELKELNLFADLLDRCLALNPERRITPNEALKHPFIHRSGTSLSKP